MCNAHLRQAACQPGRALPLKGLLPSALAEQPDTIAFMPPVEAQLRQKQRQQLLSETIVAAAEQSAHSVAGCQSDLHMVSKSLVTHLLVTAARLV